ncbi:MAG: hypothetical protein JO199_12390 [Candidatus Eremiobacteraeota bacterium]|nr:hypothetical protein [Candidatus Eremiobacteraeota bacterium]
MMRRITAVALVLLLTGCAAGMVPGGRSALPGPQDTYMRALPVVDYGTYEWSVGDAVGRWKAGTLWATLAAKHVDDMLVSFDDAELATYSTRAGKAVLNAVIKDGATHHVRFELLLGDPRYIPPSGIPTMEAIWKQLQGVNFAGLNLDLEPNEVKGTPLRTVLDELVSSMHAYVTASPWQPVALDLDYYYANGALGVKGYCLVCHLQSAGVRSIALMTYIRGPQIVASDVTPLLVQYPKIGFTIAQDVDPYPAYPQDSYWSLGFSKFYDDMQSLNARLTQARLGNYQGIVIQSFHSLVRMKP